VPLISLASAVFVQPRALFMTPQIESTDYEDIINQINMTRIEDNVRELSGFGSRVTGYPGYEEAARFIYDKFLTYGLVNVSYEYYDLAVPITYGANITVLSTGQLIDAYPLWPNLVETCSISPQGIQGPLIYAEDGDLSDFHDRVEGSIVLMDFDNRGKWINAAQLGAKAVIFIESECARIEAEMNKLNIPLDFPRLYVRKPDGLYLLNLLKNAEVSVNIKSEMKYERVQAKNVVGFIQGTERANEVVILSAHYDSMSVVPFISPGAEEATGIATLLELARFFSQRQPLRAIMFLAFSGHGFDSAGAREFVESHFNEIGSKLRLLVNLDLDTKTDSLGAFYWSDLYQWAVGGPLNPNYVTIKDVLFDKYLPAIKQQLGTVKFDNCITPQEGLIAKYLTDFFFSLDSEPFSVAGGLGISYYSTYASRFYYKTPYDTYDKLDFENLKTQAEIIFCSLFSLINDGQLDLPELKPIRADPLRGGIATLKGQVVEFNKSIAWYAPVPNSLAVITEARGISPEARGQERARARLKPGQQFIVLADENGYFTVHCLHYLRRYSVVSYADTPNVGPVKFAPDYGIYGLRYSKEAIMDSAEVFIKSVVFRCGSIAVLGIVNPVSLQPTLVSLEIKDFATHSSPDFVGLAVDFPNALIFAEPGLKVEVVIKESGRVDPFGILTNASKEEPNGSGFKVEFCDSLIVNNFQILQDLYLLDDLRLQTAEKWDIYGAKAVNFHNDSGRHIENATKALQAQNYEEFHKELIAAWSLEISAYVETKGLLRDVTSTTVFFSILLIPFTFLAERFIGASRKIIKRILLIGVIFVFFSILFYFGHPGFKIAPNVYMIIMALVLAVFSLPAIVLLFSKTAATLKEVRESLLGAHFAEISRSSAVLAAFSIGIENMRKRKMRTLLTLTSITIVIFSLISFTSVASISITTVREAPGKVVYNGVFIRAPYAINPISQDLVDYLDTYQNIATIAKRAALFPRGGGSHGFSSSGGETFTRAAIMGLSHLEAEVTGLNESLIEGHWFTSDDAWVCIVPSSLNLNTGDTVFFAGKAFNITGIYDSSRYENVTDFDKGIVTPVLGLSRAGAAHVGAGEMVIFPYEVALSLGAETFSVAMKFGESGIVRDTAQKLAAVLSGLYIYAGVDGKILTYYKGVAVAVAGWHLLIIPFVVASFSMFNLMLASVYERVREIGIFSSLGLSPLHVSGMFLAEALVYAVLGSVIGYVAGMFGSVVLHTFQVLPPEFVPNITSSWVMTAVLLGMASVLLATLYPTYKSSKLVTPSLKRKWEIPTEPVGNEWEIPLPFRASAGEVGGILAFMKEFFEAHGTERAGKFWARELGFSEREEEGVVEKSLRTLVRLQPYEAGIEQHSELIATLPKEENLFLLKLRITRVTGMTNVWMSANRTYIDSIRSQLLIWRSLRKESRERYLTKAAEL